MGRGGKGKRRERKTKIIRLTPHHLILRRGGKEKEEKRERGERKIRAARVGFLHLFHFIRGEDGLRTEEGEKKKKRRKDDETLYSIPFLPRTKKDACLEEGGRGRGRKERYTFKSESSGGSDRDKGRDRKGKEGRRKEDDYAARITITSRSNPGRVKADGAEVKEEGEEKSGRGEGDGQRGAIYDLHFFHCDQ